MNAQNIIASTVTERFKHKVLFRPQGIMAFVYSVLPKGGILKFDQTGNYACACFDNLIDFNDFRTKLSHITNV